MFIDDLDCETKTCLLRSRKLLHRRIVLPIDIDSSYAPDQRHVKRFSLALQPQDNWRANISRQQISDFETRHSSCLDEIWKIIVPFKVS